MVELIKLEVVKLCRRKLTVMVTLCCFAGTVIFFLLPYLQFHTWDERQQYYTEKKYIFILFPGF